MTIILSILIGLAFLIIFGLWLQKSFERMLAQKLEQASAKMVKDNLDSILTLAGKSLEDKTIRIHQDLSDKEQSFKSLISNVETLVKTYQQEIKATEKDTVGKFSVLSTLLNEQKQAVSNLTNSATKLNQVLHSNNLRGQWGERIADDILKASGLLEGLHYQKNKQMETSANRPDFTIFLPDQHKVSLDVKFPISNLMKAQESADAAEQKRFLGEFEQDVKKRIEEVAGRDYINPDENTLDYAILFVPSESVYALIFTHCRRIFEISESKKVVLAAPFSLIAILKVIHQSFRYFHFEEKIQEIVALIEKLDEDLVRFKERFEEFGESIDHLKIAYDKIAKTSYQKISSKIDKIERYKKGETAQKESIESESNTLS